MPIGAMRRRATRDVASRRCYHRPGRVPGAFLRVRVMRRGRGGGRGPGGRRPGPAAGSVRIIAGRWRGRRLAFPDAPGLRPSPDRLRETLFAWLAPVLPGARCIDLFAGSGALGLEAASRGAAEVVLVERDRAVADALADSLARLDAGDGVALVRADWAAALSARPGPWDVAFVDPPFDARSQAVVLERLARGALVPGARVHVEMPAVEAAAFEPPPGYAALREKRFGDAVAALLRFDGDARPLVAPSEGAR